jgi:hypothetical protein
MAGLTDVILTDSLFEPFPIVITDELTGYKRDWWALLELRYGIGRVIGTDKSRDGSLTAGESDRPRPLSRGTAQIEAPRRWDKNIKEYFIHSVSHG